MQTVSTLKEARAALAAGITQLQSPPYAACHAGVNFYHALLTQLQSEFPETSVHFTLCCGDNPAIVHDAFRMGFKAVRLQCNDGIAAQLEAIAKEKGAALLRSA